MDFDSDPGAVEDEGGRNDRQPRPERADADGNEDRAGEHRPDRMVIAADEHFDGTRADLRGADKSTERDGGGQRDVAGLQDGHEMDGDHGRDHRGDGDRRGEQDEEHPGAGGQAALHPGPCCCPQRQSLASARVEGRRDRPAGGSPDGSPRRSGRRRASRNERPSRPRVASRPCWRIRRTRSASRSPVAHAGHRAGRGSRRRRHRGRRPCRRRSPARMRDRPAKPGRARGRSSQGPAAAR